MLDTPIFRALGPDRHRGPTGLSSAALSGKKGLPIRMPDRSAAPFVHGTIPDGRIPVQSSFELRRCPERVRSTYSLSRPPRSDVGRSPPFPCGGPHSPEKNVQVSASAPIRLLRFYFRFRLAGTVRVAAPGARARPPCGRVPQTAGSLLTAARLRTAFAAAVKSISGALRRAHGGEDPASAGRIPILRGGGKICRNGRENDVARGLRPHAQAGKRPKPFVRRAETDETPIRSRNKSRSARIVRCARRGPSEAIGTHFFLPQPAFSSGETTGKASYLLKRRENRKAYEKNYPFRGRGLVRLHDRIGPREGKKS